MPRGEHSGDVKLMCPKWEMMQFQQTSRAKLNKLSISVAFPCTCFLFFLSAVRKAISFLLGYGYELTDVVCGKLHLQN